MTWSLALAVALGGAIGAPMRYLIDSRISHAAQQRGYGFSHEGQALPSQDCTGFRRHRGRVLGLDR